MKSRSNQVRNNQSHKNEVYSRETLSNQSHARSQDPHNGRGRKNEISAGTATADSAIAQGIRPKIAQEDPHSYPPRKSAKKASDNISSGVEFVAPQSAGNLYKTKNRLVESSRVELISILNQRLVDALDLQSQMKQAHWNVKGPSFIALHELFDKVSEDVESYVDILAERVVQLGGIAMGTVRVSAAESRLGEYPLTISEGPAHVDAVSSALSDFGNEVRRSIDEANQLKDAGTADIFTELSRGIDKWLWFVEAHGQAIK